MLNQPAQMQQSLPAKGIIDTKKPDVCVQSSIVAVLLLRLAAEAAKDDASPGLHQQCRRLGATPSASIAQQPGVDERRDGLDLGAKA